MANNKVFLKNKSLFGRMVLVLIEKYGRIIHHFIPNYFEKKLRVLRKISIVKIIDKIKANYTSTLAQCSNCSKLLDVLSHKGLIKNRHDARFWGFPEKRILCGNCLGKRKDKMPARKCYL